MKIRHILLVFSVLALSPWKTFSCDPPEINNIICNGGNVLISFQVSSDSTIIGFNFYRDDEMIDFLPQTGDTVYNHFLTYQPPGDHNYCITAVCELTALDFPAETIESDPDCESVGCYYGFDLPFTENWSLGSFETSDWEISSDAWIISDEEGNDPPAAMFAPVENLVDYNEMLESYYLAAYGMTEGHIFLTYDLSLSSINSTGTEHFLVQVWNHTTEIYSTIKDFSNQNGSFGWISDTIDIRPYAMNKFFRIRFVAQGENSTDIISWGIDNISVYRECDPVEYQLESYLVNDTCIFLETVEKSRRDLVDILIYVYRDEFLVGIYSSGYPMPNPYCVQESGEYCFWMVWLWETESDQCESWSDPTCEQIIIYSVEEANTKIPLFYIDDYNLCRIESKERIDRLELFDLSGRLIKTDFPGKNSFQADLSAYLPGIYFFRILTSKGQFTKKVMIR
jgi:hypothetical protein